MVPNTPTSINEWQQGWYVNNPILIAGIIQNVANHVERPFPANIVKFGDRRMHEGVVIKTV